VLNERVKLLLHPLRPLLNHYSQTLAPKVLNKGGSGLRLGRWPYWPCVRDYTYVPNSLRNGDKHLAYAPNVVQERRQNAHLLYNILYLNCNLSS